MSRSRVLRLISVGINLPAASPWRQVPMDPAAASALGGALLPPRGRFELRLELRREPGVGDAEPGAAEAMPSHADVVVEYALHRPEGDGSDGGSSVAAAITSADDSSSNRVHLQDFEGARADCTLQQHMHVPLPHADTLQPLIVGGHALHAAGAMAGHGGCVRVGERATLEVELKWGLLDGATSAVTPAKAAGLAKSETGGTPQAGGDHAPEDESGFIDVEPQPSAEWAVVGTCRQRLGLGSPMRLASARDAPHACTVCWQLVPLRAGYVPLPTLIMRRMRLDARSLSNRRVGGGLTDFVTPPSQPIPLPLLCRTILVLPRCASNAT